MEKILERNYGNLVANLRIFEEITRNFKKKKIWEILKKFSGQLIEHLWKYYN